MLVYINRCIRVMENIQLYSNTILFVCCCCFGVFGCCCYFVVVFEGWGLCVDHAIEGFYCLTHDHTHACTLTHSFTPHTQGEKNMKENIGRMLDLRTLKLSSHFQLDSLEKKRKQHDVSLNLHFKLHRPKAFWSLFLKTALTHASFTLQIQWLAITDHMLVQGVFIGRC